MITVCVEESIPKFDIVKLPSLNAVECWACDSICDGSFSNPSREEVNVIWAMIDASEPVPGVTGNLRWYVIPSGQW